MNIQLPNSNIKKWSWGFSFFFFLVCFEVGCLMLEVPAYASFIRLNTALTTKIDNNKLLVLVRVQNKGDESAFNVQAEVRVAGQKLLGEKRTELSVNGPYQAEFTIPLALTKPGNYPLALLMHYTDANQYPFSALTCQTFGFRSADNPPDIFGKMTTTSFWTSGSVKLTYKNLGESNLDLAISLIVPRELSVDKGKKTLALLGKSEQSLAVPVENFSALSGSNYQVFAIGEYDQAGRHYTALTPGMIKIVERKTLLGLDQNYLIILLLGLLAVFVVAQFIKKK